MIFDLRQLHTKYNLNITGVIHVGAHFGEDYDIYKQFDSIKNIIFFEPDKIGYDKVMEKTKHDASVVCINRALGNFSCVAKMNRATNEGVSSSVLEPHIHLYQYPDIKFDGSYDVKIEPLDKYAPGPSLNMLNMDVQGFELNVLLGATNTLKQHIQYVMAEVNRDEVYRNCAQIEDLDYFLGKYNFKRVETDWIGHTWGDAFYIKS